ncbi:MAG TPA: phospholipase D-like domain-containing protein, partial [Nannocystaceae bacterium]|nr:phospholipase D-like domain-containing protein [Nannocystaceae bacterium]
MRALAFTLVLAGCRPDTGGTTAPSNDDGKLELLLYEPGARPAPTDDCDVSLCASLLTLIEGAQQSIDFAIYGMRNQTKILDALAAAKARGVKVRGIVDRDREGKNYYT